MEIRGEAAIVTGGGSGIGADVARHLAKAGAKVAVLDLNREAAEAVAKEIGGLALECDIASAASGEAAVAAATKAHGAARILVNVAGILIPGRILGKEGPLPLEKFARVIEVNLIGTFNMMRLAAAEMAKLPALTDGERGVIISTSSVAAYEGQIGQAAYAASKAGIVGLTLPAARDLARSGIRVNAIAPGLVETRFSQALINNEALRDPVVARTPLGRHGQPADIVGAALFLASDAAAYVNGHTLIVDGGVNVS